MSEATATIALQQPAARAGLTVRALSASLLGLFAADNLLLLHFWGLPLSLTVALVFVAGTAIWALCGRIPAGLPVVPFKTFAIACAISLALFALGGEGRFFYANVDWQIRDAVLRDMATNPGHSPMTLAEPPISFERRLECTSCRPCSAATAEIALLVSDALRLALLMTLAWHLFESKRERAIALVMFFLFSGWDIVGTAIYSALGAHLSWDHLEPWNFGYQYSSHVTQAFWVPQHAIAGWTCAVAFLLWRKGLAPIGIFAASIPLVAIWSPLAIMGAVPFALFAGVDALRRRAFDLNDIALAALAVAVALPALLYLQIDAASVGDAPSFATNPLIWALCIALEVLPFTVPLLRERKSPATDRPVVRLVQFLLLAMPLMQVGVSADFQMRASIMPLALLSMLFAQWVCRL